MVLVECAGLSDPGLQVDLAKWAEHFVKDVTFREVYWAVLSKMFPTNLLDMCYMTLRRKTTTGTPPTGIVEVIF